MPVKSSMRCEIRDGGVYQGFARVLDFTTGIIATVSGGTATISATGAGIDHGALSGLSDDDHTQYAALAGRTSGQELFGSPNEDGELRIYGTSFGDNSSGTTYIEENGGRTLVGGILQVENDIENSGNFYMMDVSKTIYGGITASNDLTFDSTSHSTKGNVVIQPSGGAVGIGTTSPAEALQIGDGTANHDISVASSTANKFFMSTFGDFAIFGINRRPSDGAQVNSALAEANMYFASADADSYIVFRTTNVNNSLAVEAMRIDKLGNVGIGTASPSASAKLELSSTTGALLITRMTSTQRDALTAVNGMQIYNTTTSKFQGYAGGAWVDLH